MYRSKLFMITVAMATIAMMFGARASADEDRFSASDPVWKEECGSCHIAYPSRLLPASAWRELMTGLDKHFGTDASVEPKTAAHIGAFLQRNAGRERASRTSTSLRITDTRWFLHEHDEVPSRVWNRPEVKTASNCQACHAGAAEGDFDEHAVRLPR